MLAFERKKLLCVTLGCKLNFAETSSIGRMLLHEGFVLCKAGEHADVCIVNTCSVTDTADRKCRQAIHRVVREQPDAFVIVTGCYAQLKPDEVAHINGVDMVLGTNEKMALPEFLQCLEKRTQAEVHSVKTAQIRAFAPTCSANDRTRHFLKIQDGCDCYCTYCTIPFARGRSRSATIAETVQVAQQAIETGAREIVLTGVNTGDFGKPAGETFLQLLRALDALNYDGRFRISSIEPDLLSKDIIALVAESPHFTPHFHMPLQSGSDAVLALMHRRYDTALFAAKVDMVRHLMPHAFIGVDVMVGCRGETEAYFDDTCRFIDGLEVSRLHVFTYSERAHTQALHINHSVPQAERKRRSDILHRISTEKLQRFYTGQMGQRHTVLWETTRHGRCMHGFTENYVRCTMPYDASLINTFQSIVLTPDNTVMRVDEE